MAVEPVTPQPSFEPENLLDIEPVTAAKSGEAPPPAAPEAAAAPAPPPEAPPPKSAAPAPKPVEKSVVEKPAPVEKPAAPAEDKPPPRLVSAFDSFLAGRYSDAARIDPAAFATARARFHAYLLRAAARFTLGEIGNDRNLLAAARSDAAAAHRIDSNASPDEALFSPRFRAFYQQAH